MVGWGLGQQTRNACFPSSLIETHAQLKVGPIEGGGGQIKLSHLTSAAKQVKAAMTENHKIEDDNVLDRIALNTSVHTIKKVASPVINNSSSKKETVDSEKASIRRDIKAEVDTKEALRQQKADLSVTVDTLKEELTKKKERTVALKKEQTEYTESKQAVATKLAETVAGVERHRKMLDLLPEGEANLARLLGIVERSRNRLAGLQEQWQQHQEAKQEELRQQEEALAAAGALVARRKQSRKPALKEQLAGVGEQLETAEVEVRRLRRVVETLREGEGRESYTLRIMVILKQLGKLQEGVDAVIADVKVVQKDINMQNGKLERSFFEICLTMKSKLSNKEPHVEQSLNLLRWVLLKFTKY